MTLVGDALHLATTARRDQRSSNGGSPASAARSAHDRRNAGWRCWTCRTRRADRPSSWRNRAPRCIAPTARRDRPRKSRRYHRRACQRRCAGSPRSADCGHVPSADPRRAGIFGRVAERRDPVIGRRVHRAIGWRVEIAQPVGDWSTAIERVRGVRRTFWVSACSAIELLRPAMRRQSRARKIVIVRSARWLLRSSDDRIDPRQVELSRDGEARSVRLCIVRQRISAAGAY